MDKQTKPEEQIKVKDSEELLNKISRFYGQRKEDIIARPTKGVRDKAAGGKHGIGKRERRG
ncbi:MAG: hypothetical protein KJ893_02610 [Candidatus Omnitrophica bacterium]|nr:hypothetical protein [Candidatus Omnitrophota bacterium]MBU4479799.1 hypothetical protein [Candidatus Omnitrophota bacterium]